MHSRPVRDENNSKLNVETTYCSRSASSSNSFSAFEWKSTINSYTVFNIPSGGEAGGPPPVCRKLFAYFEYSFLAFLFSSFHWFFSCCVVRIHWRLCSIWCGQYFFSSFFFLVTSLEQSLLSNICIFSVINSIKYNLSSKEKGALLQPFS